MASAALAPPSATPRTIGGGGTTTIKDASVLNAGGVASPHSPNTDAGSARHEADDAALLEPLASPGDFDAGAYAGRILAEAVSSEEVSDWTERRGRGRLERAGAKKK